MSITRILRFSHHRHHRHHQSILQHCHLHGDRSRHQHHHLQHYLQHRPIHISKLIVLIGAPGSGKGTQSRLLEGGKIVCAGDVLREEVRNSGNEELAQILNNGEMAPEHITSALLRRKIIRLEQERAQKESSNSSSGDGSSSSRSGNASSENDAGSDTTESANDAERPHRQQQRQHHVDSDSTDSFYILDGYPRSPQQAEHFVRWFDEPTADQGAYFHRDSTVIIHLLASKDSIMERLQSRLIHNPSGRTYNTVFNPPRHVDPPLDDVTGEPLTRRDDDISPDAVRNRVETYRMRTIPTMEVLDQHGFTVDDVKEGTIGEVHEHILDILRDRGLISTTAESRRGGREDDDNDDINNNAYDAAAVDEYSGAAAENIHHHHRHHHLDVDQELVEQQRKTSDRTSSYAAEKKE